MTIYRPRPGRHLYRHVGGDVTVETKAGAGTLDPSDDFTPPANSVADLGGTWVSAPGVVEPFEVDCVVHIRPTVVQATAVPPHGEWEEIEEVDVPDSDDLWDSL